MNSDIYAKMEALRKRLMQIENAIASTAGHDRAMLQIEFARLSMIAGDYSRAKTLLEQCLLESPSNSAAQYLLCQVLREQGKHEQAIELARQLVERFPNEFSYLFRLSRELLSSKKKLHLQEAYHQIKQALKINPESVRAWLIFAYICKLLHKPEEAKWAAEQGTNAQGEENISEHDKCWETYGRAYLALRILKRRGEASFWAKLSVEMVEQLECPASFKLYAMLGYLLSDLNLWQEAEKCLQQAAVLDFLRAAPFLIRHYFRQKQFSRAWQTLKSAIHVSYSLAKQEKVDK